RQSRPGDCLMLPGIMGVGGFMASAAAALEIDSDWLSVSFLSGFEGADGATTGSYDEGPIGHTFSWFSGGRIESDNAPIGTTSLYNDGNGGVSLPMDHASFNFGSGDFTIEAKVRMDNVGSIR